MSNKRFNIFQVAGIWKSEEIHTSVIAELINPKSAFHDMGADFLDKFLLWIGIPALSCEDLEGLKNAEVKTEVPTDKGRRIDMVISTKSLYLPFEVKIWAGDQEAQLWDYYDFSKREAGNRKLPKVYYLTPDGHEPSAQSRTNPSDGKEQLSDDQICLLSFNGHILRWLEDCMKEPGIPSDVLEVMKQLRDNIQGEPNTQVRPGVQLKCFSQWEKTDVLDALYQKLSTYDLPWTECTPTYMTFTLNKKEFETASLEFALRIKKERVKKEHEGSAGYEDRVRLYLICGLTQEDGKPDYASASSYISKNYENFETLLADTFQESGLKVKSEKAAWNRLPEEVCCENAEQCCDWIEEILKNLTSESSQTLKRK